MLWDCLTTELSTSLKWDLEKVGLGHLRETVLLSFLG